MTKRGEEVKTACAEVREELNRKVAGALGRSRLGVWRRVWMQSQVCLGEIAEASPQ